MCKYVCSLIEKGEGYCLLWTEKPVDFSSTIVSLSDLSSMSRKSSQEEFLQPFKCQDLLKVDFLENIIDSFQRTHCIIPFTSFKCKITLHLLRGDCLGSWYTEWLRMNCHFWYLKRTPLSFIFRTVFPPHCCNWCFPNFSDTLSYFWCHVLQIISSFVNGRCTQMENVLIFFWTKVLRTPQPAWLGCFESYS